MVSNLAQDLELPADAINIKGKTNEGLGYLGRREGIAVTVVALIERRQAQA
jgi:2-C-methyl-D-erythritol 2,4-cyclodiphosphate synthase